MIAIKDFKMPSCCYDCDFSIGVMSTEGDRECTITEKYINDDDRPDWCPLVEIPDMQVSAQPERKKGEWIPISERLPKEEGSYLVTDDAGGVKTVQDDEFLHYEDGTPLWLYSQNVTAWKPLPEPYRGEQDE